ncbi:hypothetical protein LCGC14_1823370 [marine sediment metagenome]|uniref:Uncharacterized protein n=1 Tax=marine sediment metagenome TaxID=412755 RepID=A0A0F9IY03_9ZZZZ
MFDKFRKHDEFEEYMLPTTSFRTTTLRDMNSDFIDELRCALKGSVNKYIENNKVPYIKVYNDEYEPDWEFRHKGELIYLEPHTITGWEHERVHLINTIQDGREWYNNIASVPVNKYSEDNYQFSNGNHRVNLCNLLDLPIPAFVR